MQPVTNDPSAPFPRRGDLPEKNHRILVVDDNEAIHNDFRKILRRDAEESEFEAKRAKYFNESREAKRVAPFELDFAFQGEEALARAHEAVEAGCPYAVVFMDVRMPPGWDGLQTSLKLWEIDPDLQIVICTAYSDYSWDEITEMIATPERMLILKKPFDTIEVLQLAHALTDKWSLLQAARQNTTALECAVEMRTRELETANVNLSAEIAEHKRIEQALQESEELFRTISESSPLGIILTDENANNIYTNATQQRISGRTFEEQIGTAWRDSVHSEDRERAIREWEEIKRTRQPFRSERRYVHKDGKIVWASVTATPILNNESTKRARGYLAVVEDITERKSLEAQFLRAQRMESIGLLASGVAHDLNNILSPIMMSAEVLRGDATSDVREEMLKTIEECSVRGSELVRQVLTFARGVQGKRTVLQLRHIAKEVEKIARETFPKSINIANHIPRDLWPVTCDPTQLHQVLMNLSINARDAMPAGGTLTITGRNIELDENQATLHPDAKPGRYTLLEVMDTGVGIPQEIIHKIFDPFFTTKEAGKGTGLGLSTAIGIVGSHGGFVNVYSEIGKGSTFKVYLPATISDGAESAKKECPAAPVGAGETILLVDDERSILTITEAMLKKNGYNVLTASNGVEAISLYVRHSAIIKVVLTDVMMPLMDGVSLIRALKRMNPSLKAISTTGQAEETRQAELRTIGVKVFLKKPHTAESLLAAIHALIHDEIPH